ncbi:GNAT family N-acetyltransferase [Acaryochloris thomasi]|nr:GNAT family N-acetyltransferase [Acaryochloris thomasi]
MDKSLTPSLSVRQAQPDEILKILRVQIDALRVLCVKDYSLDQIEALVDRNISHFSRGGYRGETTFVAELENVVVGASSLLGHRISAVYIHPLYNRQGIGSQLLDAVEHLACSRNIRTLRVTASLTAFPFYKAKGYQIVDESHLVTKDGLRIRCIEMMKQVLSAY